VETVIETSLFCQVNASVMQLLICNTDVPSVTFTSWRNGPKRHCRCCRPIITKGCPSNGTTSARHSLLNIVLLSTWEITC